METKTRYKESLEKLKLSNNFRSIPEKNTSYEVVLSSNDYLALLKDETFLQNFYNSININITKPGSGSSRLLSGNSKEYNELEGLIANNYKRESCLIYNSGYHANIGILPALTDKKDLIIADKLVHASLIDGMFLSNASTTRFKHLDYQHLEKLLLKTRPDYENVFIVTESIFSMDGDIADLQKLLEIKNKYNCFLYVDEAHAIGVRGTSGLGCAEESNIINDVDLIIGTFGKALASIGAFVVCDNVFKQYLINHSRTLIYTTALPPLNLAWTKYVIERLPDFDVKRKKLKDLSNYFSKQLRIESRSHIIPYIIGCNSDTINTANILKQNGFNVMPIRYPTVAKNASRLRFSLHSDLEINQLSLIKGILNKKNEQALVK